MKRVLQFPSTRSVPQIIEGIKSALEEMGCEVRVFDQINKVRQILADPRAGGLGWTLEGGES